jgi:CMP-N-acetylneuraminic acid synthetase
MIMYIPIKHVSQRVPGKNFRLLDGIPLYKHCLLKYRDFDVYVDTDSDEISEGIKSDPRLSNVTVYKRSESLIGHEVSVCDLISEFITKFNIESPVIQTHVTSPFLNSDVLKEAYVRMITHDSVVSCNSYNSRFWRREEYGYCPVNHNPLKLEQTQDLPPLYEENSAFYIFNPDVIKTTGNRIGKKPYFYVMNYPDNLDIDTEEDWNKIEEIVKAK